MDAIFILQSYRSTDITPHGKRALIFSEYADRTSRLRGRWLAG
jgi:hypothetical protein